MEAVLGVDLELRLFLLFVDDVFVDLGRTKALLWSPVDVVGLLNWHLLHSRFDLPILLAYHFTLRCDGWS